MKMVHGNISGPPSKIYYAKYLRIFLPKNPLLYSADSEMISIAFTKYAAPSDGAVLNFLDALINLRDGKLARLLSLPYRFKRVELVWTSRDQRTQSTTPPPLTWALTNSPWRGHTDRDRLDQLSTITCSHKEP